MHLYTSILNPSGRHLLDCRAITAFDGMQLNLAALQILPQRSDAMRLVLQAEREEREERGEQEQRRPASCGHGALHK